MKLIANYSHVFVCIEKDNGLYDLRKFDQTEIVYENIDIKTSEFKIFTDPRIILCNLLDKYSKYYPYLITDLGGRIALSKKDSNEIRENRLNTNQTLEERTNFYNENIKLLFSGNILENDPRDYLHCEKLKDLILSLGIHLLPSDDLTPRALSIILNGLTTKIEL